MALPDILPDDVPDEVEIHPWTREEYERAAEAGVFGERRVELVAGTVYDLMTPQRSPHATAVHKALSAFHAAFPSGWYIRCQCPLALAPQSMPEPDIAVVVGEPDDYLEQHPSAAALVLEVVDSSQLHDRKRKAAIYVAAGIPEYWLLNLRFDALEVLRDPADGVYRSRQLYHRGTTLSPLAGPAMPIAVSDLLPRHPPAS